MVKNGKTGETAWRASWSIERWPRTHVSNVTAFYISLILMHSLTACIGYCVPEPVSFLNCEMHTFLTEADLWKCYWSTRVTMAISIVGLTCYTPLPLKVEMNNSAFQIKIERWIRKIKDKKKKTWLMIQLFTARYTKWKLRDDSSLSRISRQCTFWRNDR